jgi:hypothetical protein
MTRIGLALLLALGSFPAHAKMTPRPIDNNGHACLKWATSQDKDVQKSWGQQDDGSYSDREADFSLLMYCLTGKIPGAVSWHSKQ